MFSKPAPAKPDPHVSCQECGVVLLRDKAKTVTKDKPTFDGWSTTLYYVMGDETYTQYYCKQCAPAYTRIDEHGNQYAEFKVESNGYPMGYVLSEHYRFTVSQVQDLQRLLGERDMEINQLRTQFGVGLNVDC